jgi:ribose transport system ATP-binding protein
VTQPNHEPAPSDAPILEMRAIDKSFPGVHALKSVDLTVRPGEIVGLVGENGAGKSTLMKILSGAYSRDTGEILIDGEPVETAGPQDMIQRGLAVIYQEPALAPHLSVAENIYMGRLPTTSRGLVDRRRLTEDTLVVAERLGLDLDPRPRVASLSVARRQMVEIAKALSRDARLIVLDEPSAVLADAELDGLFRVMRRLTEKGVAFIYISHRLNEVFRITDRVVVMKDGRVVATEPTAEVTPEHLIRLMVGREIDAIYGARAPGAPGAPAGPARAAEPLLAVRGLRRDGVFRDIDFSVAPGEILGIAGLAGSGRTEVLRAIHGADPIDAGTIAVDGAAVRIHSPRDAIRLGIGLLTEDRKADGLLLVQSVATNVTISRMRDVAPSGVIDTRRERRTVAEHIARLSIRTRGPSAPVRNLSGGNQQKVIFAKWLHARCRILLIDEPTRGVDVGAKREIYALLRELAARGVGIVMVSSELPEVLGMSDRILVMREGRITAELDAAEANEERIMAHATRAVA